MNEWRKVPSVTSGGKRFFYNLVRDGRVVASVVWDRSVEAYAVRDETRVSSGGRGMILSYSPNVQLGKRVAESK